MAEPPRLREITLRQEQRVIYFVTMCIEERKQVLANEHVFRAITASIRQIRNWNVLAFVLMPDHLHCIVSPKEQRELSVGDFATALKRLLRKALMPEKWQWQRGCFDRLLRSDENLWRKWIYVRDNPVRAGLVSRPEDWRYYIDLVSAPESVGDAVSVPRADNSVADAVSVPHQSHDGKLTASPTGGSF